MMMAAARDEAPPVVHECREGDADPLPGGVRHRDRHCVDQLVDEVANGRERILSGEGVAEQRRKGRVVRRTVSDSIRQDDIAVVVVVFGTVANTKARGITVSRGDALLDLDGAATFIIVTTWVPGRDVVAEKIMVVPPHGPLATPLLAEASGGGAVDGWYRRRPLVAGRLRHGRRVRFPPVTIHTAHGTSSDGSHPGAVGGRRHDGGGGASTS